MSGRNQYMWDLKTVVLREKDIKASAATDYLTLCVAVKHGAFSPVPGNARRRKVQPWPCETRTGTVHPKYQTF